MTRLDLADGIRLIHQVKTETHFGHLQHLRFAWALLEEASSKEEAENVACLTIRHVAELAGNLGKYHHTVTVFWIRMLADARERNPSVKSLDDIVQRNPDLANPALPDEFWANVEAPAAKEGWVDPDLKPLP